MPISLLGMFNAISPGDGRSQKLAQGVPYGPGGRHKLDIYAPTKTETALPVIFFVYGGSWNDGDRRNYDFAGRALAALGYVTVIADYRLLPEVEYPAFLDDCSLAFAWVVDNIARHGGDYTRMALMGHSAGAYNALMLGLSPDHLARRGLMANVRCMVGLSGPYDFFPFDGRISLRTFGAVREPRVSQPINLVTSAAPPTLLATGGRDNLVLPRNSVALAAKLRHVGVDVSELHYPRLGHAGPLLALSRPLRFLAPVLDDVAAFLKRYL
ncbi:MAG: alpha/beta hydrolase [Candidatus Devosia phytovorans]|uniref:Alpha/beta hydrolase n=1 Tax=Candidatus Devosia phytovorans TaxID=3121372 RepID=A0AAJ5VUS8_9HYPH|nr:alpha/beta hydrolase [Devosia sp.]WEK04692.1 MAG: alpha/beta hydrolase [Devosia sp.]